jgi:hypothetical protein
VRQVGYLERLKKLVCSLEMVGWLVGWVGMWYLIRKYFLVNRISYRVGETKILFTAYCSKAHVLISMIFCIGSHCAPEVPITPKPYCAQNNIH